MSNNIVQLYQLDDCCRWVISQGFKKVVLQTKLDLLKHSVDIVTYLQTKCKELSSTETTNSQGDHNEATNIEFYVTQANTCCVDLLVNQHVANVDAIIYLGQVCLTQPIIKNQTRTHQDPEVLFTFGQPSKLEEDKFSNHVEFLLKEIDSILAGNKNCRMCVFYDTCLIEYANVLEERIRERGNEKFIEIANLNCPSPRWYTTPNYQHRFIRETTNTIGFYSLKQPIATYYNCALYLGKHLSFQLALDCPSKLLQIDFNKPNLEVERINQSKLLNKRIALVERLKEEDELKIGVLLTNPLPDVISVMQRLELYSKPRKHTLYFISMVQTIDDCKIGNFDLCDAFIIINSCTCSTILESFVFNRPIITELEYKLACGFEAEYGRVVWPGTFSHPTEEDMINKRKVSDVSLALIHTRNELLEKCSQSRSNRWSGMDFSKAIEGCDGASGGVEESLEVVEGLKGIASSYVSEPLKKEDHVKEVVGSGCGYFASCCGEGDGAGTSLNVFDERAKQGPATNANPSSSTTTCGDAEGKHVK